MKFLTDQDVYQVTVEFLRKLRYEVIRARDVGLASASDEELLSWAKQNGCILITRDKGFGALIFVSRYENNGVILLRIDPFTVETVHNELSVVLKKHSESDFRNSFYVIGPGYHRVRKILHI